MNPDQTADAPVGSYPAKYVDAHGAEETTITNDGKDLRMRLRGVEFTGEDFDSFSPVGELTPEQREAFSLHQDFLCSCTIECRITVPVCTADTAGTGELAVRTKLGDPGPKGGLDAEHITIVLEHNGHFFRGSSNSGWFEDELLEIQRSLPEGTFIKACINCQYSDYSPYGHGLFGDMRCYRNIKEEYSKVTTKEEFWSVHDRADRFVQETYLCPEFTRRIPGTGYRG